MKDIKLSFPYPKTSRHNLSQSIATSISMGLVVPVRVVEVLAGDSHRIATSFSLISNPLVKPLLQGVRLRYCRFWVPRRIYSLAQRANNSNYDPRTSPVRTGVFGSLNYPVIGDDQTPHSNFQAASLFDYLGLANIESNFFAIDKPSVTSSTPVGFSIPNQSLFFNAEPYLGYVDICRNYFADSATGFVAWFRKRPSSLTGGVEVGSFMGVQISPLEQLDGYIDLVQNSTSKISPYDPSKIYASSNLQNSFITFYLPTTDRVFDIYPPVLYNEGYFSPFDFGQSHELLCVPLNRPDRLSRLFDTRPLSSQNVTINSNEVTIGNLSALSKLQRYLTRRFFGGSRFTDVMYSIFGQKVPHVDSPILLDVFDYELGTEKVVSTNATADQNPGVLGGFFAASGVLSGSRGRYRKRYTFNEPGYIMDLVYVMPRLYRAAFYPDFYPVATQAGASKPMAQANFIPDFNGIGWQQPAFATNYRSVVFPSNSNEAVTTGEAIGFCSEPSWQQYRTLPDVCSGFQNPLRGRAGVNHFAPTGSNVDLNSPLFVFSDRMGGVNIQRFYTSLPIGSESPDSIRVLLASQCYTDPNLLNSVFGSNYLYQDNIFLTFNYSHQAKRQVTKRFTLTL